MAIKIGTDCVLGYKVGGTATVGDYTAMTNVKDLTINFSHEEADATSRANQGWKATEPTLKDNEISFVAVWDTGDANFEAFREAWEDKTLLGIAVLDGALTTGDGWELNAKVFGFEVSQPLSGVVEVSITLKVAYSAAAPVWVEGGVNTP